MKIKEIISTNKAKNRMEVIVEDDKILKTKHIRQESGVWKYFVGCSKEGNKIFSTITV